MKILIINGPNLNLLGEREPEIYGNKNFKSFYEELKEAYFDIQLAYFQSNIEGEIIDNLQAADKKFDGIILNPGGYAHTSVAIHDAIKAIKTPVVEVHLSNIYAREDFRHQSITAKACVGVILGFGLESYVLALDYLIGKE